jgi:hypothetical protein
MTISELRHQARAANPAPAPGLSLPLIRRNLFGGAGHPIERVILDDGADKFIRCPTAQAPDWRRYSHQPLASG